MKGKCYLVIRGHKMYHFLDQIKLIHYKYSNLHVLHRFSHPKLQQVSLWIKTYTAAVPSTQQAIRYIPVDMGDN